MSGFFRLKFHLGGIRMHVLPCVDVPENVREFFRNKVPETRKSNLNSLGVKSRVTRTNGYESGRNLDVVPVSEGSSSEEASLYSATIGSEAEKNDNLSRKAQKCIGRFFYENAFDFTAVNSPSFKEMFSAATLGNGGGQVKNRIPSFRDLKGWILQEEVKDILRGHVKRIKDSWVISGCTILLDEWIDEKGRNLVSFFADCPEGPVYLKSFDVSEIINNGNALVLLIDTVIKEVGADNAVQVVACSISGWVGEVGKFFMGNRRDIFWSVSASHCLKLMLEKIRKMDPVRDILNKAEKILEFIYSHPHVLKLFRDHSPRKDLIKPCQIKSAMPYTTLENIVFEKKNLTGMFASPGWKKSMWAITEEGITLAKLVEDVSFWNGAEMVVKGTMPLVHAQGIVAKADKPHVGYIYDTMDQVKETIKTELSNKKSHYTPFWDVIDEIWNSHLHSPLHAAGYFLNPSIFFSSDFHLDPEVATGLLCCLVRMVKEQNVQLEVSQQLDVYRLGQGAFEEGSDIEISSKLSPAEWWIQYGDQYPELQKFAIRILSQNCDGASRYKLKRNLAEKLLMKGMNPLEQQHLNDSAFVHYNLHMRRCKLELNGGDIMAEEVVQMDDWIVNGEGWSFSYQAKQELS